MINQDEKKMIKHDRKEAEKPKNQKKQRIKRSEELAEKYEKPFFLSHFNQLFLPLLLLPLGTALYYPVNRYVMLIWLGNGEPYLNSQGTLVERYFSANHMAVLIGIALAAVTIFLTARRIKQIQKKWKRVLYILAAVSGTVFLFLLFLEFSLWS